MYLTLLALLIIAFSAANGSVGVYGDGTGTLYIRDSGSFIVAILLAVLDFIYEAGKLLSKLLIKQEKEKPTLEKPLVPNM